MPYPHGKYLRIRVRSPKLFKRGSFRTQDIGRVGHSKRIAGRLKKTGRWATQNFMVSKADVRRHDPKTFKLILKIKAQYPKAAVR
jgi:hypothetical protein